MRHSLPPGRAAWVVAALLAASAIAYALTPRQERAAAPAAAERPVTTPASVHPTPAVSTPVVATQLPPAAARPAPELATAPLSAAPTSQAMRTAPMAQSDEPGEAQLSGASFRTFSIEEQQALARREAEGLVTVRHPDGSESMNHEGRFADYTVVRIGPDGKPIIECVPGEEWAKHALHKNRPLPRPAMEDR